MNHSVYPITRVGSDLIFSFVSNNSFGTRPIDKIVNYGRIYKYGIKYYGLGLGDYDLEDDNIYDNVVTNNGDMRKVLNTVVHTLGIFFTEHPGEKVLIEGSDPVRNVYYQKLVRDYYDLILTRYKVEGYIDGRLETFNGNTVYEFIAIGINKNLTKFNRGYE